ncbi:MAG: ribosome small subunit-dependent GTPase A, partial [Bacilli bacterium]|nr:ribosome small subunit-dependent GTPase A [Bacilli bacterium]
SIANIDSCIITTSTKSPKLDLNLLDKLLCLNIYNNIKPIICFTKLDLLNKQEKKEIKKLIKYYNKIGVRTLTNLKIRKITKEIKNKTVVLTGQSGSGKSTLLNKLNKNLNLATNPISKALGRGVHTTRHVELFKYKTSLIADTPGFSSLTIDHITKEEVKKTFIEFNLNCEYQDCYHLKEPNCEVKKSVDQNKILKSRYKNYKKFIEVVK